MAFAGSREIAALHVEVPRERFRAVVAAACAEVGTEPGADFLDAVSINPVLTRLLGWQGLLDRIRLFGGIGAEADGLRQFFLTQHVLNDFPGDTPFDDTFEYPAVFRKMTQTGAEGLLCYGAAQFEALAETCRKIVKAIALMEWPRLTLLESPLGNVVPVAVLSRLLEHHGLRPSCVTLSLPRNDRVKRGLTYREIIDHAAQRIAQTQQRVLYIDDVLTGTRFRKIVRALQVACRRHGAEEPTAAALVFKPHSPLTDAHRELRISIRDLLESQATADAIPVWNLMPELPSLLIDRGPAVRFESPVVWGECDLVAGRRRVNLIFNLIEEFRLIAYDLTSENATTRTRLRELWAEDVAGIRFEIRDDSTMRDALRNAVENIDWHAITERAKGDFRDEYEGRGLVPADESYVIKRIDWLRSQIVGAATHGDPRAAQMLWNALKDVFVADRPRRGDPRDRDFCYLFYPYNRTIRRLHDLIVERTTELAG